MSEKRDKIRHVAFTESETNKISEYAKHYNMTSSEFIRQAINDKIRLIENPEPFNTFSNPDFSDQIIKSQEFILEELKLMKQKFTTINGIRNGYKSLTEIISDSTYKENLKLKADKIKEVMKESNKGFTPKELNTITGFDLKSIDLALTSNHDLFKLNMNGRWVLNE